MIPVDKITHLFHSQQLRYLTQSLSRLFHQCSYSCNNYIVVAIVAVAAANSGAIVALAIDR